LQGRHDVLGPRGGHGPEEAGGLVPPGPAGLVPERCQADDQTLQLLRVHHGLHTRRLPAELEQNLAPQIERDIFQNLYFKLKEPSTQRIWDKKIKG